MKKPQADSGPGSIYDPEPIPEDELWFLPAADSDTAASLAPPLPRADRRPLLRPAQWAEAEARLAGDLARAALAFGALDERLRQAPEGLRQRIALNEVSEMSWHLGDRVPPDRLALYLVLRLAGPRDDARALMRAAWAVRRLQGRMRLEPGGIAAFLDRSTVKDPAEPELFQGPQGAEFAALAEDWQVLVGGAGGLHPISRAALAWHAWRMLGLSGDDAMIEGAVVAAVLGAVAGRGGAGFLAAGMGGGAAWRAGGPAVDRLAAWYAGVERAALHGLLICDRLAAWDGRARDASADLSGRTPGRLIALLAAWPLVSAPMAEAETGASRAAVQRNLAILERRGLAREVTGHSRFRFWEARL